MPFPGTQAHTHTCSVCVRVVSDPQPVTGGVYLHRNKQIQEQLWEISVNIVKDFLSPEVLEKYGPRFEVVDAPEEPADEEEQCVTIEDGIHRVSFRASIANTDDDLETVAVCYYTCYAP